MGKSIELSVCVLLVISVLWKPAFSESCSLACKGNPTAPTFLNGHKYTYGVEGTVSIFVTGADKQETSVKLLGEVFVVSLGNCVNELKVRNLAISGPDGKKYSCPPGIDKPVRFTLQDGRVGSEICAETGDTRRSLNIKRAIISLLQTENKPSTQVDIFGACPTEASFSQEGHSMLVHRTRDLSRCAHREQGRNDLVTGIFNPTAEIKNTQVLQSTLNVESKVNSGVPEKVSATEEYLYKPFSVGENGAKAKVNTKLTLNGKSAGGNPPSQCSETRTIIFENPHGVKSNGNYEAAVAAVRDTAKTLNTEASSKSAGEFAQLVRILRFASKEDLTKIYGSCKTKNIEKRVFLDALLRVGTGASIEASIEILKGKELNNIEEQLVFLSLGNARHVNNEALKSAASLLDLPKLPKEIYLGVGALAGSYCRDHNCHTVKSDGIVVLSQKLAAKLQNCRPKSKVEEDYVVAVLKGIRNIRHLEDNLIDKLARCANDNNAKARVRAAALEAFAADPCAAKLKKTALDLMKNRQQDSEIRIKAYLAVIECPCGGSANVIKTLLDSEPVHQVGHFITSSLRHIRASSNPDKIHARQHYGLISTPNRFNIDDRKYSFYREASYNIDALGIGGSVEQTVIYSQDSFLPRSANLNLTAELFGHSLNVLEVGGRQGNLDRVAEHFLGPKSFLRTEKPQDIYDTLVKKIEEAEKKFEGTLSRGRRSVKTEVDNFDKHLKAEAVSFNNELDLDVYLKLFGTDALFLSLGDDKGLNFNNLLDYVLGAVNGGINQLKHFQQELRAHLLFLDAELAYPTLTGLPLKLDLVGAATGRLELATNIDIRQIYRNPKSAKLDVKVVPSTDIEVTGTFLVDADAVSTGLKVITNLHSSTGGHVIVRVLEDGRGFDLQLGLPIDKQEIVTASNDLVYFSAEKGEKEKRIPLKIDADRKEYFACFDQLSNMLGLTLCGELLVPFQISGPDAPASISKFLARYPLTGSSKVKVVLEKSDLKGYHVKGVFRGDNFERQSFELLFEAEGSKNRRTSVTGELVNTKEEKSVKLSLESPLKNLFGQLGYYNKPNELVVLVKGKMDQAEYLARAGFNVQGNDRRRVYSPVIEYQLPDDQGKHNLKVDGQLIEESSGRSTKFTIEGIKITWPNSNEVVDVNGHLNLEPNNGVNLDLKAKTGDHNVLLSASRDGCDVKVEFQNTLNPNINFKVNGHFENNQLTNHNDIELVYGPDLRSTNDRVVFNQLLKRAPEGVNIITKNKFEIACLPLKVKLEGEIDRKKVDIELEGVYLDKSVNFDLEARTEIKKVGDYSFKCSANVDKQGIELFSKRDIVSAEKSNLENYIVIKGAGKYELSGVVLHKMKANDMNVGAIGHLKISGGSKNEEFKFDIGAIENANLYSTHGKVSCNSGVLLDALLKVTRGPQSSGQLKFILKDTIVANGQYKLSDSNGKGHGLVTVDFKKAQRKIKADVKFVVKDPVYNADVDIFLNFEKDNNDKIHFSTNTMSNDKVLDTKTKLEYAGKKTELNIKAEGDVTKPGKARADVEVVLPTERCLSLKLDHDLSEKNDVENGHVEYILSDSVKRGGAASTVTFKYKSANSNFEKGEANIESLVELKLKDGQNLLNVLSIKNVPTGPDSYKFDYKVDVSGSLSPKPASVSAVGEIKKLGEHVDCKVKGHYGDNYFFEYVDLTEAAEDKFLDDSTLTIRTPIESARDFKYVSYVLLLAPKQADPSYTITQTVQLNGEVYKVETTGTVGFKEGNGKVKVVVPHEDPIVLEGNYKADTDSENKKVAAELKSQYGKGRTASIAVEAETSPNEYGVILRANAPQAEKLKKLELQQKGKYLGPDTYSASYLLDADGQVYQADVLTVSSKSNPVFDLKYKGSESSQPSRIYLKGNALSSTQGKVELKLANVRDITLDFVSEGYVQKDNVAFKMTANSEKLGFKNYNVDISSKDAGSGKRLEFHATNGNKNVLSGSTTFISKQEGPKTIIEGSGSVKLYEEQKSANFKYIRTVLTEGNEQGIETFLNLVLGERSYVAETRATNLEYKTSYVYCEEKKQCANIDIQSKFNAIQPGQYQHLLNIGFDLRKLGFAPEFGLQVSNEVSEKKLPQYTLDLHVNKDDKKYYLHAYSQPEHGRLPSGITITLPHRVLALEAIATYPTNKAMPFPIRGEVALHLDKNKPQQKTAARFLLDVTGTEKQHGAVAELGFSHPKLGKELLFKVVGNLQHANQNSIKIESSAIASHTTLGKDREIKFCFEADPVHVKVLLDASIVKVIDLEGSASVKDNIQQADLTFSILDGKPVKVRALAKDFQYYEFTTGYSDESERKLSIVGRIAPEKRVEVTADIILNKEKKNIVHGALFLQDNLVKNDYGFSKDNYKYFINALQTDLGALQKRVQQLGDKASQDAQATLKRIEPQYKQLEKAYTEDLEKLAKEITNDQTLKEISEALDFVVKFVAKTIDQIITITKPIADKICSTISTTSKKILEIYDQQIAPLVKKLYETVGNIMKEYFDALVDLVAHYAALVNDFFEKHRPELEELTNTLTDIFKDVTRLLVAQLKEMRIKLAQICNDLLQQIKELPLIQTIKEKLQELPIPEQALGLLAEFNQNVRGLLPTEETRVFSDALYKYVAKKIRQEKVDDTAELRALYEKLAVAITSVVQFVRQQANQFGVPGILNFNAVPTLSGPGQTSFPSLGGSASFSILNQLLKTDFPDPIAFIRAYRVRSLNPLDEIPSKLRAVVVNGQHIFTFDGRHLTFPGNCRYVLTHDHVDRNFSLALQLQNGQPKALILEDKSGNTVELKDNGQTAQNGAAHPYPVLQKDSFSFRHPGGYIGIGTSYGLLAMCSQKLEVCYVEVNGFYLGKLRGLLGDGNNEPYDDFRLPNGKITNSESEFGNAYRLASSCPQVKTPEHSHHEHHATLPPACEKVFGSNSVLRPLALVMDAAPFRQACIHAVASGGDALQQACDLARGYTALATNTLLPAVVPPVCLQCTDADKPRNFGDEYELKLPHKQADILVTVETTVSNERNFKELVVPLMSQLVDNLKSKQISDIKVYLMGISPKMPYPYIHDSDIKLKNAKVKFDDQVRYPPTTRIVTGNDAVDKAEDQLLSIVDQLKVQLGLNNIDMSYQSVFQIPFRPGAVKHIIYTVGEKCSECNEIVEMLYALAYDSIFKNSATTISLVGNAEVTKIGGGKDPSQVVGYTRNSVLMLGDKKQNKDSGVLRASLEKSNDPCLRTVEWADGLVLSSPNYVKLNPGQQKQFLQTAAAAITSEMLSQNIIQECVCSYADPYRLASVCVNKARKEAARRRK